MGRASRRKRQAAPRGRYHGVDLFEDSRLLYVVLCQLHYDTVGDDLDPPFPLADVEDPDATNANTMLSVVQQHRGDPTAFVILTERYFHRDSMDVRDGLDLRRGTIRTTPIDKVPDVVQSFCVFAQQDQHLHLRAHLCARPEVYDFSKLSIDQALDAWTQKDFVHVTVAAPDGGVQ